MLVLLTSTASNIGSLYSPISALCSTHISDQILHFPGILLKPGRDHKGITEGVIICDNHFSVGACIKKSQGGRSAHAPAPPAFAGRNQSAPDHETKHILFCAGNMLFLRRAVNRFLATGSHIANIGQGNVDNLIPLLLDKMLRGNHNDMLIGMHELLHIDNQRPRAAHPDKKQHAQKKSAQYSRQNTIMMPKIHPTIPHITLPRSSGSTIQSEGASSPAFACSNISAASMKILL